MAVMLPVMLLARKLDSEDVNQVQAIRIAYGCIQAICVLVVLYVYYTASSINEKKIIYVPPAPQVRVCATRSHSTVVQECILFLLLPLVT